MYVHVCVFVHVYVHICMCAMLFGSQRTTDDVIPFLPILFEIETPAHCYI